MNKPDTSREAPALARLLEVIREVAVELHPHRRDSLDVTLDTSLAVELALDSMGRMELVSRIDHAFGVTLRDEVVVGAETARDLWHALEAAPTTAQQHAPGGLYAAAAPPAPAGDTGETDIPLAATTLLEVLDWHVAVHPDRVHLEFVASDEHTVPLTYDGLRRGAEEVAAGLRGMGVGIGQTVAIMLPTSLEFFLSFFGILRAGCIPVPIYPPTHLHLIEDHLRRHAAILESARAVLLVTVPGAARAGRFLRAHARTIEVVVTVAELRADSAGRHWPQPSTNELALLQYTSGSTGNPKGVMLTHANLLANIRAMGQPLAIHPDRDVFVSWLPLYHDMGLIGAWLGSLYFGMKLVVMSPLHFLARPERWLWTIMKHRGTLSASPNFGYELCLTRIKDEDIAGLDLSRWRVAANGAEAVLPSTLRGFQERFKHSGLSRTTQRPVYGLAESSVGLAFPPTAREPLIDRIKRDEFTGGGQAVFAAPDDSTAIEFVGCGQPIPGHEIRIVDAAGREAPDREEGSVQCRGPSTTQGDYRNHKATRALFAGDWLRTGDRGYMVRGDLFITGREKDVVKRAGRNLYAPEIEARVGEVEGVRRGCVAVFGARKGRRGTESLVVMAETRETDPAALERLRDAVSRAVVATIGEPPNEVALVKPHTVLKTSSGKIRRDATWQLFEAGEHEAGGRAVWLQMARLVLTSVAPEVRDLGRRAAAGDLRAGPAVRAPHPARRGPPVPPRDGRQPRGPQRTAHAAHWPAGHRLQPHQLPGQHRVGGDPAARLLLRRQALVAPPGLDRSVLAPPRHPVRGSHRSATRGFRPCGDHRVRQAGRGPAVLPGRHTGAHGGFAAVPDRDLLRGHGHAEPGVAGCHSWRPHNPARRFLVSAPFADYRIGRPGDPARGDGTRRWRCAMPSGQRCCVTRASPISTMKPARSSGWVAGGPRSTSTFLLSDITDA